MFTICSIDKRLGTFLHIAGLVQFIIMMSSYDVKEWKNFVYIYHIQDISCRDQICKDPQAL